MSSRSFATDQQTIRKLVSNHFLAGENRELVSRMRISVIWACSHADGNPRSGGQNYSK